MRESLDPAWMRGFVSGLVLGAVLALGWVGSAIVVGVML